MLVYYSFAATIKEVHEEMLGAQAVGWQCCLDALQHVASLRYVSYNTTYADCAAALSMV
jgi:hypothetical protein